MINPIANKLASKLENATYTEFMIENGYSWEDKESTYYNKDWQKEDAFYKWCACLHMFNRVAKPGIKVVDLGAGDGPICHIISDQGYDVVGVDVKPWYYPYKSLTEMIILEGGAVEFLASYEDESVDIFIDGCAVTHFECSYNASVPNMGWKLIFEEVRRVMKPYGYFIVTSDVETVLDDCNGEIIAPEQIIKMAGDAGLKLTSGFNRSRDNIICRKENRHDIGVANFMFIKMKR